MLPAGGVCCQSNRTVFARNPWKEEHVCEDFEPVMLITISNLYPRPDQPTRGMFNFQLFQEMVKANGCSSLVCRNICLVPSWKIWQWPAIRQWAAPDQAADHREAGAEKDGGEAREFGSDVRGLMAERPHATVYLPVFCLPIIGRSINWWFYYRALKVKVASCSVFRLPSESTAGQPLATEQPNNPTAETAGTGGVLLASWLYPDGVALARVAKDMGVPAWLRVHGTDRYHLRYRHRRRLILEAVSYAKGVICNCKAVADDLVKGGLPAEKIHIVPNGVDTSLFRYRNKEELLGCQAAKLLRGQENGGNGLSNLATEQLSNSQLILFIGNLVRVKGADVMLKAFARLVPEGSSSCCQVARLSGGSLKASSSASLRPEKPNDSTTQQLTNPILLVIGSGPMQRQLERLARKLGVADRVYFLGNRPHGEVALWMNAADVLCLTSRSEGMPNVVVEALVSGLPVVATAVGACPELLADEPAARVCRSEDSAALAGALKAVLDLAIDREALAGRHVVRNSWRRQAETLLRLMAADTVLSHDSSTLASHRDASVVNS